MHVISFSIISYYSNMRLISKMYLEQNCRYITLDIHASTVERPPHLFLLKPHSANKLIFSFCSYLPCPPFKKSFFHSVLYLPSEGSPDDRVQIKYSSRGYFWVTSLKTLGISGVFWDRGSFSRLVSYLLPIGR